MQVFLALLVLALIPFTTLTKAERISKKGCNDTCGGVSIPFPFGIGINCSESEWFNVDCNSSTPYLSALNNMEVLMLQAKSYSYVTVNFSMTFDCQNQVKNSSLVLSEESPYYFSTSYNSLFVEGCGIYADVSLDGGIFTGCSTICRNDTVSDRNNCTDIGCCQADISASNLKWLSVNVRGLESPDGDGSCGSGSAFFMDSEYFNRTGVPRPSLDGVNIYVPITLWLDSGISYNDDYSSPECKRCRSKGGYCYKNLKADSGTSCYIYKKSKLGVILAAEIGFTSETRRHSVMKALTSKQVLQENDTSDTSAVTSLTFTHRALSDVSCLAEFKKLEKLDLTFNSLSSLEGLKPCVNLKWLSVKQNKLRSLKGIEGCVFLTVLNAGSNMLQSMDEVSNLVRLRALILNDNEIGSICRLDQMKELNTIVLSRNPISKIGESLGKSNSITKLSLSNCKIQDIDSSIKYCTELRELRLTHNEIRALPTELARNTKLQNLDLGNNLIMRWSDLKILSSLTSLKNLNLVGNPVVEKDVLAKKIKNLVPSLQIFNARPIDKVVKNVVDVEDMDTKKGQKMSKNNLTKTENDENTPTSGTKLKRKSRDKSVKEEDAVINSKKVRDDDDEMVHIEKNENRIEKRDDEDDVARKKKKRVKSKASGSLAVQLLSPEPQVGLGGPSAWDI